MISRLFTTGCVGFRQQWTANKSSYVENATFNGLIQQSTAEELQQFQGLKFGKTFTIYCPIDTDVQEGDKITADSTDYDVKFIIDRNMGLNKHKQIIAIS